MIRVAAYCRVSTDKDDQANSFDSQQRYFSQFIGGNPDWKLHAIYADEGITGTSTRKRVQFNRMIADAHAGAFTLILTKEISRFSRNILDTITYTRELKRIGVGVYFMTENLNSMNPEAELLMTFMGVLAQEESRRTSARVKWGQTRRMEQGVVFGHSLLGYDVQDGKITVNREEAELVRLIFRKYAVEGKGTSVIARELREAGYLTKTGNPNWRANHIIKILHNEKYVGDLVQKKSYTPDYLTHIKRRNLGQEELVILHDHHEPIISREIWEAARTEMTKRDKHGSRGHSGLHLFSGKIRCGECGAVFVSRRKPGRDGTGTRRWCCAAVVSGGRAACSVGKLVRDDDARNMLKNALKSLELDREALTDSLARLVMNVLRAEAGIQLHDPVRIRWQMDAEKRKKSACLDAWLSGDITKEEMQKLKMMYDARIADLEQRLACPQLPTGKDEETVRNAIAYLLSAETDCDIFYRSILDHLTVCKDRHLELRLKELPCIFYFA